ncbi:hypothetical protein R1flu_021077 [Riccia fluitans]|uniref:Uncharacterized protein n=1 Tax=Riccia fluitans TaxID=41844 RepID=A0ABD1ZNB3_9MARC
MHTSTCRMHSDLSSSGSSWKCPAAARTLDLEAVSFCCFYLDRLFFGSKGLADCRAPQDTCIHRPTLNSELYSIVLHPVTSRLQLLSSSSDFPLPQQREDVKYGTRQSKKFEFDIHRCSACYTPPSSGSLPRFRLRVGILDMSALDDSRLHSGYHLCPLRSRRLSD